MSDEERPGSDKLQHDIDAVLAEIEDFESHPRSRSGLSWAQRFGQGVRQAIANRLRRPSVRSGKARQGGKLSARGGYWRGRYITYDGESRRGVRAWLRRWRR